MSRQLGENLPMSPELGGAPDVPRPGVDPLVTTLASSKHRTRLDDAFFLDLRRGLGAVIDGIGSRKGGGLAARTGRDAIQRVAHRRDSEGLAWPHVAITAAREAVILGKAAHGNNMGATAVAAAVDPTDVSFAWCGDARGYGVTTKGEMKLLTRDHGVVDAWRRHGLITPEQAEKLEAMLLDAVASFHADAYAREIDGLSDMFRQRPGLVNGLLKSGHVTPDQAVHLRELLAKTANPEIERRIGGKIGEIVFAKRSLVSSELGNREGPISEAVVPAAGLVAAVLVSDGVPDNLTSTEMSDVVVETLHDPYAMSAALVKAARASADSGLGRFKPDDMTALVLPIPQR